ncbi:MAG TPA: pseudouridine synthase [Myxococcota bacterium]|nr:pseudouridine synthase [Myxococcota bacterium]
MGRIHKFISDAGVAARRKAEELVAEGRVTVNGQTATIGQIIDPSKDRVMVDGNGIRKMPKRIYLMMNKPREVLCTAADARGRRTVFDLLPELPAKVHSVGRLDFMSEGLLLFTNDGDLTRKLTHPSGGLERVYEVKLQGPVRDWVLGKLVSGVQLEDGFAKAVRVSRLRMAQTNEWLSVTLAEGRYREVRRMMEAVGYNVLKLRRVRFGPVELGDLKIGGFRYLTDEEVMALQTGRATPLPKPGTVIRKHVSEEKKKSLGWAVSSKEPRQPRGRQKTTSAVARAPRTPRTPGNAGARRAPRASKVQKV